MSVPAIVKVLEPRDVPFPAARMSEPGVRTVGSFQLTRVMVAEGASHFVPPPG